MFLPKENPIGYRTDALNTIKGIAPGKLPFAPRFDLWFNAHQYRGTLPDDLCNCTSTLEVARKIGVGAHLVVPNYLKYDNPSQLYDRGIGLYRFPQIPYTYTLKRVERIVESSGSTTKVTYKTPKGSITVEFGYNEDMRNAGISISHIKKYILTDDEDFEPLMFLFEHIAVEPYYEGIERMIEETGEDGLVVARGNAPASPMQLIMHDLMDMTSFFYAQYDKPEKLQALADAIGSFYEQIMPIAAANPGHVIMFGSNTDETITPPPFFKEHLMPWISRMADMAHAHGKFILLHADGENQSLFGLYRQSGIDILEAVATAPMTKSTIHEVLEKSEGMTVWGGIPSVVLLPDSFSDSAFEAFMEETLDAVGTGPHFILGVSDTTPPDADFRRLIKIRDMIAHKEAF